MTDRDGSALEDDLIFDIGMHTGKDSEFYLDKGFRVVGVEAAPALCKNATTLLERHIDSGRLVVIEKALSTTTGDTVEFFIHPEKDDWGSLFQGHCEKGSGRSERLAVETVRLGDLIDRYGVPYYIKCDIEGGDAIFIAELAKSGHRPPFVSIEATDRADLLVMRECGYTTFQIVNQFMHPWRPCPKPSREGQLVEAEFTHEMSGPFGLDLPADGWIGFDDMLHRFDTWYGLRALDEHLAIGWLDVHATRPEHLDRGGPHTVPSPAGRRRLRRWRDPIRRRLSR